MENLITYVAGALTGPWLWQQFKKPIWPEQTRPDYWDIYYGHLFDRRRSPRA